MKHIKITAKKKGKTESIPKLSVSKDIIDAIDMMKSICGDEKRAKGIIAVREMLMGFDAEKWKNTTDPLERYEWLSKCLNCAKQ